MFPVFQYRMMAVERFGPYILPLSLLLLIEVCLKGWALWRAARMGKNGWFIALLIINSGGIFPALYLFFTKERYAALEHARASK